MKTAILKAAAAVLALILIPALAWAHCQIPCGIYDDELRFRLMLEHAGTIEKSMQQITLLSSAAKPDQNQLVRWISNKDEHADQLAEIATDYFLAQRIINPGEADAVQQRRYVEQLKLLHSIVVLSMKAKQSTDLQLPKELRTRIDTFRKLYRS